MFKRTHTKIITIFLIIGFIIITGLGALNILNLNEMNSQMIETNLNLQIEIRDINVYECLKNKEKENRIYYCLTMYTKCKWGYIWNGLKK